MDVLSSTGGAVVAAWGVAHVVPTGKIVAGFGPISDDNRNIVAMEWVVEGLFLVFTGVLVIVTNVTGLGDHAVRVVDSCAAAALIALAVVSLFTGFKVRYLPFRLCPVIFTASAALILAGAFT